MIVNCSGIAAVFTTWRRKPPTRILCFSSHTNTEQLRAQLDQLHSEAQQARTKGFSFSQIHLLSTASNLSLNFLKPILLNTFLSPFILTVIPKLRQIPYFVKMVEKLSSNWDLVPYSIISFGFNFFHYLFQIFVSAVFFVFN